MIALAKRAARGLGVDTRAAYHALCRWSLKDAIREQGLSELVARLRDSVPDLRDQFTGKFDEQEYERYWELKMRAMHAWQIRCVLDGLAAMPSEGLTIADIGDSSGTHAAYIRTLAPPGKVRRMVGVNLDGAAVARIRAKGGEGIQTRAEELHLHDVRADLFLSFETIEHLTDPLRFLHRIAAAGAAEHLLITVPLRRVSRFGGMHLRLPEHGMPPRMTAEEMHIYEFSPEDWSLLVRFAGFRPLFTRVYRQYASWGPSRLLAPLWRALDFEGFFAIFARRDLTLANHYADW